MNRIPKIDYMALRLRAERMLERGVATVAPLTPLDLPSALHELQTHHLELELQNEELRRSQQELEVSRRELADLFEYAPVAYLVLSQHGVIRNLNQTATELLRRQKSKLLALPLRALVCREDATRFYAHLHQVFGRQVNRTDRLRLILPGYSFLHVELLSRLVCEPGQPPCCRTAILDLTERHQAEKATRTAQQQLRDHAERQESTVAKRTAELHKSLEEQRHFAYSLAHDLRAPLRAIRVRSGVLLEQSPAALPKPFEQHLHSIIRSADHLERLIVDALDYNKSLSEHPAVLALDPTPLLRDLLESSLALQPPQAEVRLQNPLPWIQAHPSALTRCFANLLDNAVKFVEPGRTPTVLIRAEAREALVRLWFEDNGIGISPKWQARIFEPFERASPGYVGTGIGLAFVRKAVERMGGQVGVESQPGGGSRFWLELPAAPAPP